jgi:hypothetical protein
MAENGSVELVVEASLRDTAERRRWEEQAGEGEE